MSTTTAYCARWVLPITSAPIEHGAVIVSGTRIERVARRVDIVADRVVDLGNAILLPGLVNVHTHLELTPLRGFLEGLDFGEWLRVLTAARAELFDPPALHTAAVAGIYEGLRSGITTFADATASGASCEAMNETGVRGIVYLETFGPAEEQCAASMRALRDGVDVLRKKAAPLVTVGVSPHAPYTVSRSLFTAVARFCHEEQLPSSVHVAESAAELEFVKLGTGPLAERLRARGIEVAPRARSPVAMLHECGMLEVRPLLVHCIGVDDDDLALMKTAGAAIAHCPVSNAKLGHGIAPLSRMIAAGIDIGLGTDSVASNNRMDIVSEARQAALLHSLNSGKSDSLPASAALELATIGGARALGMDRHVGSLEAGKLADIAAFSLDHHAAGAIYDPAVALVHSLAGGAVAKMVLINGEERVWDDEVRNGNPEIAIQLEQLAGKLREWRVTRQA